MKIEMLNVFCIIIRTGFYIGLIFLYLWFLLFFIRRRPRFSLWAILGMFPPVVYLYLIIRSGDPLPVQICEWISRNEFLGLKTLICYADDIFIWSAFYLVVLTWLAYVSYLLLDRILVAVSSFQKLVRKDKPQ
jgi:hypothetical protein